MQYPNRVCGECGVTYTANRIDSKFCSPAHRQTFNRLIYDQERRTNRVERACEHCRLNYLPPRSDSRFCSGACRQKAIWQGKKPDPKISTCEQCARAYAPRAKSSKFCSIHCQRLARYDRDPEGRRRLTREYNAAVKHTDSYRTAQQAKYNRRRALKLGAGGPGLSLRQWRRILRRARGRCYYCNGAAKLTMDHVLPLSRGGVHSEGNVVAACESCNYSKGGKLLIEWRMRRAQIAA